jgi:hypothetical protein
MSQADGNVANATGAVFRADLNTQLAALWTQHSGNAAPTPTYAFQPWVDTSTTPATWRVRNSANNGWIAIGTLDATFAVSTSINALVPAQTGNSGSFLTTNGTSVSWGVVGANPKFAIFGTSSTWTCPTGVTQALVSVVGGGGGGGGTNFTNDGGYGGLGGVGIGVVSVTPSTIYTITVGAGGAGNNGAGGGSAGGTSSFGPQGGGVLITATGGSGGGYDNAVQGAHGSCSSASANVRGSTNIAVVTIPYISGQVITRGNAASSTAAVAWTTSSGASPGSCGSGEATDGTSQYSNATGGYGGAVVIQYWGQ